MKIASRKSAKRSINSMKFIPSLPLERDWGWGLISLQLKSIKFKINCKGILLFFFSLLALPIFSQKYNFKNFNSEDGLAQSYVYSIIQDVNGYLWIGTGNGLSRYNGFTFENYTISDSLQDNFITCGISTGESLWFGHMNGRISFFNGKKFNAVNLPSSNESPITHFAISPEGEVWVSTYSDGLLKLGNESGVVKYDFIKDQVFITTFVFLDSDQLLVGTNTGLLFCRLMESGDIDIIRSVSEIPESKVTDIQIMRNKSGFYIATENDGLFNLIYKGGIFRVSGIISSPDFDYTGIQDIYEDSQSNIWICSFGNGLIKINDPASGELTNIDYFNNANGFSTDNVKTVYEDREGNIWSGNYGDGLTQITPKTFSVYTFDKLLYGNNIFSIYFNQEYKWIGTENGLIKMDLLTDKIVKFYGKYSGLPKDTVTTIYSNDGKELWIGTEKNGVFRMDTENEKFLKLPIGDGVPENSITFITGKGEQVWIGTKKGLYSFNSGTNNINWYSISQGGLPHNYINCLFIDSTERLWVSTLSNTLAYIQDEKVFKVPINYGSGMLPLYPITEDKASRIWVGSIGNGVYLLESDSFANLTVKEGLVSNYCYSLICDDQNNIWVGHKGGLSRIRTADFSIKPILHIASITDNYQFNPNAIFKDQQGRIWFGSDQGIVSYDPAMEYTQFVPPALVITSLKVNDEEQDYVQQITLSPGNYKIRIDFLGINLKEPSLVTYQYRMDGYDQWSEITKNTFVTYPLKEGDYTFILKASSGDGAVSENPLTIRIIIKMPIWKKWWFYPAIVVFLIILTYSYIKRREFIFLAEKKILEEKVLERTHEIQSQKDEIELQRDLIHQKNANIMSSIKYASQIQNAVLPPLYLLNKFFPDNFILSKPKDIVSGDFYWLAEKDDKIVFAVADCTGHGVPGAFMSLLGITLLNEIVNIQGITKSDTIVTKLRERVIQSVQQGRKDITTTDGMEIALCVLDKHKKRIQFTGAMSDLVFIRERKLEIIRADCISVCFTDGELDPFTMKEIDCRKGDVFYLFSDGYQDQFGGDLDKKYLRKKFFSTLLEIHEMPMLNQKEILDYKFNEWSSHTIQTDDVTIMGIRI